MTRYRIRLEPTDDTGPDTVDGGRFDAGAQSRHVDTCSYCSSGVVPCDAADVMDALAAASEVRT